MDDNGGEWVQETVEGNSFWFYYDSNGDRVTGWIKSNGYWYYCYDDGTMAHDTMVNGYYVNNDGQWTKDEGSREIIDGNRDHFWYYVGTKGKAVTGWNKIGDTFHYYYYYPDGSMAKNDTINGFDIDNYGNIVDGTGWIKDEYRGEWHHFSDGTMENDKTIGVYHIDESGKMITGTGWVSSDGSWYFLKNDEEVVTNWLYDQGNWYYLYPEGSMAKGWIQVKGEWYYLNSSGEMQTGWIRYGDSWYYFDEDGKMKTGWIKDNGKWYYLNSSGEMKTGWLKYGDSWYYFDDDGTMAHDTMIGEYYVNADGEWVPNDDVNNGTNSYDNENSAIIEPATDVTYITFDINKAPIGVKKTLTTLYAQLEDIQRKHGLYSMGIKIQDEDEAIEDTMLLIENQMKFAQSDCGIIINRIQSAAAGVVQAIGGATEASGGATMFWTTSWTGVGIPVGVAGGYMAVDGASNFTGGISKVINAFRDNQGDTANFMKIGYEKLSPECGDYIYNLTQLGLGLYCVGKGITELSANSTKVYPRKKNIIRAENEGLSVGTDILDVGDNIVITTRTPDGMILQRTLINKSEIANGIIFIGVDAKNTNDSKDSLKQ